MKMYKAYLKAGCCVMLASVTHPALAQNAEDQGFSDIVVTAQKRGENVQRVPISITALTPDALDRSGLSSTSDLQAAVPGLVFSTFLGDGQPYLRGVGNDSLTLGADSSVSVYVDGVYMARTGGALQEVFDVERVEVVKGPQGTLFGRNSVGGSINIVNRLPQDHFEARGDLSLGNNGLGKARAAINVPLASNLFIRASGITSKQNGFFRNLNTAGNLTALPPGFGGNSILKTRYGGIDLNAGRLALRWVIAPETEFNIVGDISDDKTVRGATVHSLSIYPSPAVDFCRGAPFPCPTDPGATPGRQTTDPYSNYLNLLPTEHSVQSGVVGTFTTALGFAKLTSITGFKHYNHNDLFDLDGTDYNDGIQNDHVDSNTLTQELQLASSNDGPLQWVTGLYYLRDRAKQHVRVALASGAQLVDFSARLKTTAWAMFAQGTYSLADSLKLTLGGRYSYERKAVEVDHQLLLLNTLLIPLTNAQSARSWKSFTPKIGLDWQISNKIMAYASAQKGFKSGGYNTISTDPTTYEFQPEKINAYEIGFKSTFLENRIRFNTALFYYDYKNLQVNLYDATAVVLKNAAKAKIKGVDFDLSVKPVQALELKVSGEYLDAKFKDFVTFDPDNLAAGAQNLSGNRLPRAPKFSFSTSANYTHRISDDLGLEWFLEYAQTGHVYYSFFNQPAVDQGKVGLLNGRITAKFHDDHLSLAIWGKNITNKIWSQNVIRNTSFAGAIASPAMPRTYGVTLSADF